MPKAVNKTDFYDAVQKMYGNIATINRKQILALLSKNKKLKMPTWLTNNVKHRVGRGEYALFLPENRVVEKENMSPISYSNILDAAMSPALVEVDTFSLVPMKDKNYVPWGHFGDVKNIIASQVFYPMYITGLSGNGKTVMVEQACAAIQRECIRVNITTETDEDDLLGGFRLVDGKTVWQNGPVIIAMERGAILLLDEIDLGTAKLMCLQPILEGKPIFLKKINKKAFPKKGFNIIATANTKGKGSEDGRFIGTNIMNEAFLERFSITLEQSYPNEKYEKKILEKVLTRVHIPESEARTKIVSNLIDWADIIRKSFYDGAVTEIITTRRLIHICEAYAIFNSLEKAIDLCLNRFDLETKLAFLSLWNKVISPEVQEENKKEEKEEKVVAF
jgi:hypothetical protein